MFNYLAAPLIFSGPSYRLDRHPVRWLVSTDCPSSPASTTNIVFVCRPHDDDDENQRKDNLFSFKATEAYLDPQTINSSPFVWILFDNLLWHSLYYRDGAFVEPVLD